MPPPGAIPALATVQIALLPDNKVSIQAQLPGGRLQFNALWHTAEQNILEMLRKQEEEAEGGIVQAPPGTRFLP
jgi:hypothetical protein